MTLIELLWIIFFIGGGACAGNNLMELYWPNHTGFGKVFGGILGYGAGFLITYIGDLQDRKHPPCRCGKTLSGDFKSIKDPDWFLVQQCSCGLSYLMRKGWLWFEILPNREPRLYMRRNLLGNWVLASDEIRNRSSVRKCIIKHRADKPARK